MIHTMNTSRKILADNIRAMIVKEGGSINAWAKSKHLQQRQIDRLVKSEHAVSLDTLDEIANALGLMPWQLLVADLDLSNLPKLVITETEVKLYQRMKELIRS